jgi:imidazole glycerol-phosphate synthase subunit HisH
MICIVDYGVGNLKSIQNMLKRAGVQAAISNTAEEVDKATKLILPGMGHFDHCMQQFNRSGMRSLIEKKVLENKIPVLGICVGLQMFMQSSEEGKEPGLNWVDGKTIRFQQSKMDGGLKVPNMGWLETNGSKDSTILNNLQQARFYFAHSYHVDVSNEQDTLMTADYGYTFPVAVEKENITGVQFHPEKSHRFGMTLLKNFAEKPL